MHADDLAEQRRSHCPLYNDNKMKIGVFGINVDGGGTMSSLPSSFEPTFDHNVEIALNSEKYGFEFLIPFGRWKSFGGDIEYNGNCMEVYTWAAGLAAKTEEIMIFATSHVPTVHPIIAAKQGATIDHISNGRWGLNVVCGWYVPEMEMFGAAQLEHDERYEKADEWVSVVKKLWSEQHFDHEGKYYKVTDGYLNPKPCSKPRPVIVNAGVSDAGKEFSAKQVDFNFITWDSIEVAKAAAADVRARAHQYGREIGILGNGYCIVRDTEREAKEVLDAIVAHGDKGSAENIMNILGIQSESFGGQIDKFRDRFYCGWGAPMIMGTPEQVVDQFLELEKAGIEGMALIWQDYNEEIPYFGENVIPLMKQAGLRV
ncbi:MAG: LLM class flavin-dependent oxidoreductase [Pseudomonadota bacterium]